MIKAVIFDMDGVIVDTEPIYLARLEKFLKHNNVQSKKEILQKTVGSSSLDSWKIIQQVWGEDLDRNKYKEEYDTFFKEEPINYHKIMNANLIPVLNWLSKNKYKIGLASSSPISNIKEVLKQCEINHYFDSILSGEMFKKSKPHPEIYIKTAEKLRVQPNECLMIEDSNYGIAAGKAAGMHVFAKEDDRFYFNQYNADKIIVDLKEIIIELKNFKP